jgi:hypothetical protein
MNGVTTPASSTLNVTGSASFVNFTNGSPLNIAAGLASPVTFGLRIAAQRRAA